MKRTGHTNTIYFNITEKEWYYLRSLINAKGIEWADDGKVIKVHGKALFFDLKFFSHEMFVIMRERSYIDLQDEDFPEMQKFMRSLYMVLSIDFTINNDFKADSDVICEFLIKEEIK